MQRLCDAPSVLNQYPLLTAREIASLVTSGEVRASEVLEAALLAIAKANPHLNAVTDLCSDGAAAQITQGLPDGPLAGVPVLLKELGCPAIGTRSTFGSELFAQSTPWSHDCAFVKLLKAAGAIVLGRTNTCEFGISLVTEPRFRGPTRNPHAPALSAGGSSGGSAAAVAAGMVPLAHGTDGCGSLRVPASHCGLFGLKPSRGRISYAPDFGESWAGMSVNGAITRTVYDSALLLDMVGIPVAGDPYRVPCPAMPFREAIEAPPDRLLIGILAADEDVDVDIECRNAVERAATLCASLGHEVTLLHFSLNLAQAAPHLMVIWSVQLWTLLEQRYGQLSCVPDGRGIEPLSWALACEGRRVSGAVYLEAVRYIHHFARRFSRLFEHCDVLLSPVAARSPWPLGFLEADDPHEHMRNLFALCPYTVPYNMTGGPAMSVPLHRSAEHRLPVGVQFGAEPGQELRLLQLAAQLEAAAPWAPSIRVGLEHWQMS